MLKKKLIEIGEQKIQHKLKGVGDSKDFIILALGVTSTSSPPSSLSIPTTTLLTHIQLIGYISLYKFDTNAV